MYIYIYICMYLRLWYFSFYSLLLFERMLIHITQDRMVCFKRISFEHMHTYNDMYYHSIYVCCVYIILYTSFLMIFVWKFQTSTTPRSFGFASLFEWFSWFWVCVCVVCVCAYKRAHYCECIYTSMLNYSNTINHDDNNKIYMAYGSRGSIQFFFFKFSLADME